MHERKYTLKYMLGRGIPKIREKPRKNEWKGDRHYEPVTKVAERKRTVIK